MTTNRVSNLYVEVYSPGTGTDRVSTLYTEVVAALFPIAPPDNRVSMVSAEVVTSGPPADNRATTLYLEVITPPTLYVPPPPTARAMVMV